MRLLQLHNKILMASLVVQSLSASMVNMPSRSICAWTASRTLSVSSANTSMVISTSASSAESLLSWNQLVKMKRQDKVVTTVYSLSRTLIWRRSRSQRSLDAKILEKSLGWRSSSRSSALTVLTSRTQCTIGIRALSQAIWSRAFSPSPSTAQRLKSDTESRWHLTTTECWFLRMHKPCNRRESQLKKPKMELLSILASHQSFKNSYITSLTRSC